jgi:hypothetical protein
MDRTPGEQTGTDAVEFAPSAGRHVLRPLAFDCPDMHITVLARLI